tara:strand:- start:200 stop:1003 length:804 start_codon:yes stop_codon:yes gene_type:complete
MKVIDIEGKKVREVKLPKQFSEPYHPNLIKRAVLVIQSNKRQPYGAKEGAGLRHSSDLSKRRKRYRGVYGRGMSRTPRKVTWRRGTQFGYVGAKAPGTRGGRKAHPPTAEKDFSKKINIKERRKAIRSALAATFNIELIKKRTHQIPKEFPFIIDNKIETLEKTKEVKNTLKKIGFEKEIKRCEKKKVRAGKGKVRGRKYKKKTGPLIIVSRKCKLLKSGINLPGVEIVDIKNVNVELLAPGTHAGRLTIYTESAINKLEKDKLFTR